MFTYMQNVYDILYINVLNLRKTQESASQRLIAAWWWRFPCVNEYQSNNPF